MQTETQIRVVLSSRGSTVWLHVCSEISSIRSTAEWKSPPEVWRLITALQSCLLTMININSVFGVPLSWSQPAEDIKTNRFPVWLCSSRSETLFDFPASQLPCWPPYSRLRAVKPVWDGVQAALARVQSVCLLQKVLFQWRCKKASAGRQPSSAGSVLHCFYHIKVTWRTL